MPSSEISKSGKFYYVYILESVKYSREIYIGSTNNLRKRFKEHNLGQNFSTKSYLPWKLIYYEACLNKKDVQRRENYFKTTQGRRLLKRRLKEYFYSKNN